MTEMTDKDASGEPRHFKRSARLTKPSDYQGVFGGVDERVSNNHWTILATHRGQSTTEPSDVSILPPRLGLAIAKKRARRAVDRNRIKRVVRESFRHNRDKLTDFDLVVMNRDAAVSASTEQLRTSLAGLWDKLARKAHSKVQGGLKDQKKISGGKKPSSGKT